MPLNNSLTFSDLGGLLGKFKDLLLIFFTNYFWSLAIQGVAPYNISKNTIPHDHTSHLELKFIPSKI